MTGSIVLDRPERPMTVDELLFELTARGYIKATELGPPDESGMCDYQGPADGVAHWRSRAVWQDRVDGLDFLSIYPCNENDEEADTFIFVLFNPRNGVIVQWRVAEHWTGDDLIIKNCPSFEVALKMYERWLESIMAESD